MRYYLACVSVIIFPNYGVLKIDQRMSFKNMTYMVFAEYLYYKALSSRTGDIFINELFLLSKNLFKI